MDDTELQYGSCNETENDSNRNKNTNFVNDGCNIDEIQNTPSSMPSHMSTYDWLCFAVGVTALVGFSTMAYLKFRR